MPNSDGWVAEAAKLSLAGAGLGLIVSATQNAVTKHNAGATGVLTKYGSTIGYFAVMGGVFAGTRKLSAEIRNQDDFLNSAAAGCAAGFIAGLRKGSIAAGVGACAFLGTSMGLVEYTGGIQSKIPELTPAERERIRRAALGDRGNSESA